MAALPQPLRQYGSDSELSPPEELEDWRFCMLRPPYTSADPVRPDSSWTELSAEFTDHGRGCIVVGALRVHSPTHTYHELDWLRTALPFAALAIEAPTPQAFTPLASLLSRLAKHGIVVLPERAPTVADVADAISAAVEPNVDVRLWVTTVLPGWSAVERQHALQHLADGLAYDPEAIARGRPDASPPSRQPVWVDVGRALHAALILQDRYSEQGGALALLRAAHASGYADTRAMNRALMRAFGVTSREIRGTAGWEWLMWRFVVGDGTGKRRWWGQRA